MPRIELFPFRYRDPRTGRWTRARYVATREEIAKRYAEWEIAGPAGIRDVDPDARAFTPHASFKLMMDAELRRYSERPPEVQPAIDAVEAFLLAVFLRRYVTYCARRGRFSAMKGRRGCMPRYECPLHKRATPEPACAGAAFPRSARNGQPVSASRRHLMAEPRPRSADMCGAFRFMATAVSLRHGDSRGVLRRLSR